MFSIDYKNIKSELKDKGSVNIPYYAGKCISCRHLNGETCTKKFVSIIRKYVVLKIHDSVCIHWDFNLKYFTSMTRRNKDGKNGKNGENKN